MPPGFALTPAPGLPYTGRRAVQVLGVADVSPRGRGHSGARGARGVLSLHRARLPQGYGRQARGRRPGGAHPREDRLLLPGAHRSAGFYVVVARLGDESVGERLRIRAGSLTAVVTARFDPADHRQERGTRVDFAGAGRPGDARGLRGHARAVPRPSDGERPSARSAVRGRPRWSPASGSGSSSSASRCGARERVPPSGPVLLCINHPNNLIDSLLVGAVLRRKVHYLATAALFRNPLLARFLRACGAIPVYRTPGRSRQDGPERRHLRRLLRALERGQRRRDLPGGHDPRRERASSGSRPARRASPSTTRRGARRRERAAHRRARSGSPSRRASRSAAACASRSASRCRWRPTAPAYRDDPAAAVEALTTAIQWRHGGARSSTWTGRIGRSSCARSTSSTAASWSASCRRSAAFGRAQIDPFRLSQSIADAVAHFEERDPERVDARSGRTSSATGPCSPRSRCATRRCASSRAPTAARDAAALRGRPSLGLPFFAYGAVVNAPAVPPAPRLARRIARKETDYATTRLLASIVAFPLFWGLETWIVWRARWAPRWALALPRLAAGERAPRLPVPGRRRPAAGPAPLRPCLVLTRRPAAGAPPRRAAGHRRRAGAGARTTTSPPPGGARF